jgi:quercetin dioxygenase-like cupin family protein
MKGVEMSDYEVKNVEPIVVSNDIQVRVFTLAQGDVIPWHYHRESADHYFVLQGALTIQTRGPDNRRVIPAGERYKILPGTAHCISNESASECQFLLSRGWVSTTGIKPMWANDCFSNVRCNHI